MEDTTKRPILCFGEVLWDSLPGGLFLGGAPVNVAYHLRMHGLRGVPVTAVGADFLGREILRRLKLWGIETDHITIVGKKPTGVVHVSLDAHGEAHYEILEDAAWDWIDVGDAVRNLSSSCEAIVYGSLAQRSRHNREQFQRLLRHMSSSKRIFDVNLRPPFDDFDLVRELSRAADLIKLNGGELHRLTGRRFPEGEVESQARFWSKEIGKRAICVTCGASGAGMLIDDQWFWEKGRPVHTKDTVGAGDAFLASLVVSLVGGETPPPMMLQKACRTGEFVAGSYGATPLYEISDRGEITPPLQEVRSY